MILQRIGNAVRNQDWFVVLIEVLIVILGVFIGLQVDDWNNERKERVQEQEILERLYSEAESAVTHISNFVENRAARVEKQENMIAFISDPEKFPMDEGEAARALTRITHFPSLKPSRSVLDELTTSGQLQLIRSQEVRDALGHYAASLSFHDGQLEAFRDNSESVFEASLAHMDAQYTPDGPSVRSVTVDWPSLRADRRFFYILLDALRNQFTFQAYRNGVLRDAVAMCELLAEELGRECKSSPTAESAEAGSQ